MKINSSPTERQLALGRNIVMMMVISMMKVIDNMFYMMMMMIYMYMMIYMMVARCVEEALTTSITTHSGKGATG